MTNIPVELGFLPIKPITSTAMTNFESKQSDSCETTFLCHGCGNCSVKENQVTTKSEQWKNYIYLILTKTPNNLHPPSLPNPPLLHMQSTRPLPPNLFFSFTTTNKSNTTTKTTQIYLNNFFSSHSQFTTLIHQP